MATSDLINSAQTTHERSSDSDSNPYWCTEVCEITNKHRTLTQDTHVRVPRETKRHRWLILCNTLRKLTYLSYSFPKPSQVVLLPNLTKLSLTSDVFQKAFRWTTIQYKKNTRLEKSRRKLNIQLFFFLLSFSVTPLIYLMTLLGVSTPRLGTTGLWFSLCEFQCFSLLTPFFI